MPGLAAVQRDSGFASRSPVLLDDAVTDLDWMPDGSGLLAGSASGDIHHIDRDGALRSRWQAHQGGVTRLRLQPGRPQTLASAGEDGRVCLWHSADGTPLAVLAEGSDWVEHMAWTADGSLLAAAARRTISLWRGTESLGIWYDARRQVLAIAWAPDGRRLASAANKGLYLWRLEGGRADSGEPAQLLSFPGAPVSVAWHPRGDALAAGTQDGFLQIWRPATGARPARQLTMRGYPGKVACLAWHPARPMIATAGGPDLVWWELPGGDEGARGRPLRHHRSTVTALAWCDDGALLASGDRAGQLCVWDQGGDILYSRTLEAEITGLRWQPGGRLLAIGDSAGGLRLLDCRAAGACSDA